MRISTLITAVAQRLSLMQAATAQAPGGPRAPAAGPAPTTFVVKFKIKAGQER